MAGRKILKIHQDMVSPIIADFGGAVVKMIGDSVMAYFLKPEDAFKSAIKIQQKIQSFNNNEKDQMHIRLCIHYGDGIEDDGDIFGDVVNMAAKFLPLAGSDEIIISHELQKKIRKNPHISFNQFEIPDSDKILHGMKLFKVVWDDQIEFDPTMKTLIHLRPLWILGKKNFESLWDEVISNRDRFWSSRTVEKEHIDKEKTVSLIVKESSTTIDIASSIINFLQINMGKDASVYVPIQIIIDKGAYIRAGKLFVEGISVNWKELEPGEVYASKSVFDELHGKNCRNIILDQSKPASGNFYKISENEKKDRKDLFFRYQNALVQGEYSPCFYCSSRSHHATACPSKMMSNLTRYTEKLGYMNIVNMNELFFHYLEDSRSINDIPWTIKDNDPVFYAHNSFYELKSIFQLRLLMVLWNNKQDNWNRLRENDRLRDKGGHLWLGLDCIRVGNHAKAESIIEEEIIKKNKDYRVFCLAALLFIERNNYGQAILELKRSFDLAEKTPEKIYILFLLFRTYYFLNYTAKAREMLERITRLNPYCTEAVYQKIVLAINTGNKTDSLDNLVNLVKKNRDYYVIALIDPELSRFNRKISTRFEGLFLEARENAKKIIPAAEEKLDSIEKIIGEDNEEINVAREQLLKMDDLLKTDSYFGYLDSIHYSENILKLGNRIIQGCSLNLFRMEKDIRQRVERCNKYLAPLPYKFMTQPLFTELEIIQSRTDAIERKKMQENMVGYKNIVGAMTSLTKELSAIEKRVKRVDTFSEILTFALNFLKKNLFFQSANLGISFILLPVVIHYFNFIIPDLDLVTHGIWPFQKVLIIFGGISGVIMSYLTSQNKTSKQP
jgi:tetratricopeptide (TPR) repeat protein